MNLFVMRLSQKVSFFSSPTPPCGRGWHKVPGEGFKRKPSGAFAPPPLQREVILIPSPLAGYKGSRRGNESCDPVCLVLRVEFLSEPR